MSETLNLIKDFDKTQFKIYVFPNPLEQEKMYKKKIPKNINVIGIDSKGIIPTRNKILNYFKENEKIFFLDDDITKAYVGFNEKGKKYKKFIKGKEIEKHIIKGFEDLKKTNYKMFGFYPVENEFFMSRKTTTNNFIIATFFGIINTELRFDKKLYLKEDYDFTIQHNLKYGGAIRYNYLTFVAKHYTNKGGCQTERNDEKERLSCEYLKLKWQSLVKDNPKRENEILLNL